MVPLQGLKRRRDGVRISCLSDYPVLGFVVEGGSLAEVADVVGSACLAMQAANVPHNLLISDAGARVFVFPQCYAEKQARGEVAEELLDTGGPNLLLELLLIAHSLCCGMSNRSSSSVE